MKRRASPTVDTMFAVRMAKQSTVSAFICQRLGNWAFNPETGVRFPLKALLDGSPSGMALGLRPRIIGVQLPYRL